MTKQKILLLIPLTIVAGFLVYSWGAILFINATITWRHCLALTFFVALIYLYFKSFTKTVLATGLYFIIGTCNLLTLTPAVTTNSYGLRIGSLEIWTPTFQLLSFGLFILYFILNFDILTNIYFNYKQTRKAKSKTD